MKVTINNHKIDIKNENTNNPKREFNAEWNGYSIKIINGYSTVMSKDNIFFASVWNPLRETIVDDAEETTMLKALQMCFDNIALDIEYIESTISDLEEVYTPLKHFSNKKDVICPVCYSKKIFKFRLDSDWGSGIGDYSAINSDENYTDKELNYDSFDRPDIEIFVCGNCGTQFD